MKILLSLLLLVSGVNALPPAPMMDTDEEAPATEASAEESQEQQEADAAFTVFEETVLDHVVGHKILSKSGGYEFTDPRMKKIWVLTFDKIVRHSLGQDGEFRRCGTARFETNRERRIDLGFDLIRGEEDWFVSTITLQNVNNQARFRWGPACKKISSRSKSLEK